MDKIKIIIDTDIGDDIDDAFALQLAFGIAQYDLLGVTTVYKNVVMRAKIVKALLDAAGVCAPVYCGKDDPVCEPIKRFGYEKEENGKVVIRHYDDTMADNRYSVGAADFILDCAERYPGQITLFSIGPMTNVAEAAQKNPDKFAKLRNIYIMGGILDEPYAEWNVKCDPEAAQTVLRCGVPLFFVGLNVTRKCVLSQKYVKLVQSVDSPSGALISKMMQIWMSDNKKQPMLHDPLTVAAPVTDFIRWKKRRMTIGLRGADRAVCTEDANGTEVNYAMDADSGAFEKYWFDVAFGKKDAKIIP